MCEYDTINVSTKLSLTRKLSKNKCIKYFLRASPVKRLRLMRYACAQFGNRRFRHYISYHIFICMFFTHCYYNLFLFHYLPLLLLMLLFHFLTDCYFSDGINARISSLLIRNCRRVTRPIVKTAIKLNIVKTVWRATHVSSSGRSFARRDRNSGRR